ncbi:MAG: hypothetical protein EPN41_11565 [Candidimonas sp.]|nr:MAG: hypothetical protein EPN41_11565 [Candidimonas sp.]
MWTHVIFMILVAVAVYAQSVTGFAVALILLGLVGLIDLVPLPDAANVVTIIMIANALMFFYSRKTIHVERAILSAVATTMVGIFGGMAILTFLATHEYQVLRLLLGFSIVACALLLWRASSPYKVASSPRYFAGIGLLSGLLGGMFAAPGPPLVYAVYRQPWPIARIQESLIFCFGVGAVLRLLIVLAQGDFSHLAVMLTIDAVPVTLIVTAVSASRPLPVSGAVMKNIVSILLIGSGFGMLFSSLHAMLA